MPHAIELFDKDRFSTGAGPLAACDVCSDEIEPGEPRFTSDGTLCLECARDLACAECGELRVACVCLDSLGGEQNALLMLRECVESGDDDYAGEMARLLARKALGELPLTYRVWPSGRLVESDGGAFHVTGWVVGRVTDVEQIGYRVRD